MNICNRCILDETTPDITFDIAGDCNYCKLHDKLSDFFPLGDAGKEAFLKKVEEIKRAGIHNRYDCIVGVSGGTDSTYLIYLAKEYGLRPLAVNFDNGWHSEIAVSNLRNSLSLLDVDLETYVVDYQEINDLILSYMKAGVPWIDGPTDIGIVSTLYRIAKKEGVKCILVGNNFRIEGRQPEAWTFTDGEQLRYIHYKYGTKKLKTFPNLTSLDVIRYQVLHGISLVKPFYYLDFNKSEAMEFLKQKFNWQYYGGHHHESIFTRFAISYWQYKKFNIDKRKVTYSAMIRSKQLNREEGLKLISELPYSEDKMEEDRKYVINKLGITELEFQRIWDSPNKSTYDYFSMLPIYKRFQWLGNFILSIGRGTRPMSTFGLEKK
jgi:N-acetyl sugar amidotransferase